MKILISSRSFGFVSSEPIELLKAQGFEVDKNPFGRKMTEEELSSMIKSVVGMVAGTERISKEVLEAGTSLKVISRAGIGMDNIDLDTAKELGILVYNTPDAPTIAVAELTMGLILTLLRRISKCDRELRDGGWNPFMGSLLTGKTVGIIGLGRIGKAVASFLDPFEVRTLAYDPVRNRDFAKNRDLKYVDLDFLLKESDIISLHIPLLDENHHFISKKEISTMKEGALLINTSRGGIVDENALYRGLKEGRIGGVALDTFENEPYKGPLTKLENVVLTPHIGSYAKEARLNMELETVENLLKGLRKKGVL